LWRGLALLRGVSDETLQEEAEKQLDEMMLPDLAAASSQGTANLEILRFLSRLAKLRVLIDEEDGNETVHLVPPSSAHTYRSSTQTK
jgi:hypothetical protein